MITETLIRKMEDRTANYRVDAINRLGKGVPLIYVQSFLNGCDGVEEIYQKMMQDQLGIYERRLKIMKSKSKGLTKNQKLKKLKTSKLKKTVKSTKK